MKWMKAYGKDHWRALAALPVLVGAAASIWILYGLPAEPLLYAALVCGVLGVCLFVLPDFFQYVRRTKALEASRANLRVLLELPSFPGSLPEETLAGAVRDLCEMIRELETDAAVKRQDMMEYYTLWVHQVKTPLSAMRLILQSAPKNGFPEAQEALKQELFRVERYVEMVLGYLRLETLTSDLRLENCPVQEIVRQAVKKYAPQFIYRKLSLSLDNFENRVVTDRKWLLFVVEQLLSNAVKYTKTGGVTIWMDENDVLYIRDTGVGIAPEDLPRIFERGFTGKNGRLERTSTGLGLYLTRQVLDRLQTRIEMDSRPGRGTEVRLYLHKEPVKAD